MRVVIADDAVLVRAGVVHLLTASGIEVVAECANAEALVKAVALQDPDVAVIDIRMPPTYTDEGIVAARRVRQGYPRTSVLVLSQYLQPLYARRLMADSPAHTGYLLKEKVHDIEVLVSAMDRVVAGSCVVDEAIVATILGRRDQLGSLASLSDREAEVLGLMARGLSNIAMSSELGLSPKTIEMMISAVFRKLNLEHSSDVNRRVLAVLETLTRGDT